MIRVLVADDELLARKAMASILQHSGIELQVIGEFDSAESILEYLETVDGNIDILITDIRMGDKDGLQVAKYIEEKDWDIQVILISGYAEFTYAQKAIRYGVKQYLTKPLDKCELLNAVRQIIEEREESMKDRSRQMEEKLLKFSMEELPIKEMLSNQKLSKRLVHFAPNKGDWNCFRMVVLQINVRDNASMQAMQHHLQQLCSDSFKISLLYFSVDYEWLLILFGEREKILDENVQDFMDSISFFCKLQQKFQMTAGVSEILNGFELIYTAYSQAVHMMNFRLLKGWNRTYFFHKEDRMRSVTFLTEGQKLGIKQAVLRCDIKEAKKISHSFFSDSRLQKQNDLRSLYNGIVDILSIVNGSKQNSIESNIAEKGNISILTCYYDLHRFYTVDEIAAFIDDILENICMGELPDKEESSIVWIENYISNNYFEQISLEEVANHELFMSTSYLSRLFKVSTGYTFSQYLISFRIEKAVDLLENSSLKINEVAEHVGFNDTSHFIKSFRKYYHMTPKEYRNQL